MKLKLYQVDAFADKAFGGNPAAIVPLEAWLSDDILQKIAQENNLSETAFFVKNTNYYELRWFTPNHEVDLCGHATLAAAYVIFNRLKYQEDKVEFQTRSGLLIVTKSSHMLTMDFPAQSIFPCDINEALIRGLGNITPIETLNGVDYVVRLESEEAILNIKPNPTLLMQLDLRGVCVTAPGNRVDFVSRFFAPKLAVPEDPVTGSAHCYLTPYWSAILGKNDLHANQISSRGGEIFCQLRKNRVFLSGKSILFMEGSIQF